MEKSTQFLIWKYMFYCWVEIGLDSADVQTFANQFKQKKVNWKELEKIIFSEVLWGFSLNFFIYLIVLIPILGLVVAATVMPDMEYADEVIDKKIASVQKLKWFYWLNPLCWLGYPVAYLVSQRSIANLKSNLNLIE